MALYDGIPIYDSWVCPTDKILFVTDPAIGTGMTIFKHPWFNLKMGEYRPPFYTRCSRGVREAERDRRKYPRLQSD